MVCVAEPEKPLAALQEFGLVPGVLGAQRGTGAHHAAFFFNNAYLELAWPTPGAAAFSDAPRLHFQQRAQSPATQWCPFGVSFRLAAPTLELPLATWAYPPPFLPPGAQPIPIGENSDLPREPIIIASLVSQRPDTRAPAVPLHAGLGLGEFSRIRLFSPAAHDPSPELRAVAALGWLRLEFSSSHHLELEFGAAEARHRHTFAPDLPLSFRW
jgi:hypothetical protein